MTKIVKLLLIFSITTLLLTIKPIENPAFAAKLKEKNYFSSLRSSRTNVRAGPGRHYPIKFTFKMRSIPVKVTGEYDNWNEIKDFDGESGWVDRNLLTKRRTIIVKTDQESIPLNHSPRQKSRTLLLLEQDVVANFVECQENWCLVKIEGKKGWLPRSEIWGVDEKD